jgi:hypothetical protein
MRLQDFQKQYLNRRIDIDGAAGYQCVDISKAYAKYVWGVNFHGIGYSGGAKDMLRPGACFKDQDVERIQNSIEAIPPAGSVVVFDRGSSNPYGHTGVCITADMKTLTILEQNGGMGYGYSGNGSGVGPILGWIIPKNGQLINQAANQTPVTTTIPQVYQNAVNNKDARWLYFSLLDRDIEILDKKRRLNIPFGIRTSIPQDYVFALQNKDLSWLLNSILDRDREILEYKKRLGWV